MRVEKRGPARMSSTELLERVRRLEARNYRVENDKAWETSWTRRLGIALLTYVVVGIYLTLVVHINPLINAWVPAVGYLLSTLTLSLVKRQWLAKREKDL
jgi:hypothetical protein